MKVFTFHTDKFRGSVGFSVIETTDDEVIIARKDEIVEALSDLKAEKSLDMLFLAVVNIVSLHSNLLLLGPLERRLALASFPALSESDAAVNAKREETRSNLYFMGGRVSRKLDYIPAITRSITRDNWDPSSATA